MDRLKGEFKFFLDIASSNDHSKFLNTFSFLSHNLRSSLCAQSVYIKRKKCTVYAIFAHKSDHNSLHGAPE